MPHPADFTLDPPVTREAHWLSVGIDTVLTPEIGFDSVISAMS